MGKVWVFIITMESLGVLPGVLITAAWTREVLNEDEV